MRHIQAIPLRSSVRAHRIDLGRTLVLIVTIGLLLTVGLVFGVVVRAGITQQFDQSIPLYEQHVLVIHYGPSPTCASIPNPPQHDCIQPGAARREFSMDYLTPQGARSLVWLRLWAL